MTEANEKRRGTIAVLCAVALAAFVFGAISASMAQRKPSGAAEQAAGSGKAEWYTCSMHPQIQLKDPKAKCPICFMDLISVSAGPQLGPRQAGFSHEAAKLAEIRSVPVERRFVDHEVRLVGKVVYDETRVKTITAWVNGRLERLYADYTGIAVKAGEHLVRLYSPEILVAEQELQSAYRAARETRDTTARTSRFEKSEPADRTPAKLTQAEAILEAARKKLQLWGVQPEQIRQIEESDKPADTIEILAPIGGIVIQKQANQGMYVNTGTPIYTIADLSRVWVTVEAYESDLVWIRYGQTVTFETRSLPGETFSGRIAFIDPVLNPQTRTVRLRVNVENPDFKLKPEMFVRAVVRSKLSRDGAVVEPELAGKWISPMHPEVVKDGPGNCDVCGMPLVRAETLGYAGRGEEKPPLVIPATAPLITGARAVVYLQLPGEATPLFEGRTIRLGPRAGEYYIVREGDLKEGDLVVTQGNFKIDSALQIMAKESMMSQEGGPVTAAPAAKVPVEFLAALTPVYDAYLTYQTALAADKTDAHRTAAKALRDAVAGVDAARLPASRSADWKRFAGELLTQAERLGKAGTVAVQREVFAVISEQMLGLVADFGHAGKEPLHRAHCPMAFDDRGADWLQRGMEIVNPYFGSEMLRCGKVTRAYAPAEGK